ncbi:MAG: hypothetical protein LBL76_03720, partial [Treponema sp.]|nr:hypothetical protein [Treponema sp.]
GLIMVLIVLATAFLGVWLVRTLAPLFHKGRRGLSCCSHPERPSKKTSCPCSQNKGSLSS